MKKLLTNSWVHLSCLSLLAVYLLLTHINKPFIGLYDDVAARWGNYANSYLVYGLDKTKFGLVMDRNVSLNGVFQYDFNHLIFTALCIYVSYIVLGVSEWSTRIVPMLFSLSSVIGMYSLGKVIGGRWYGLLSGMFLLATPAFITFGRLPVPDVVVVNLTIWLSFAYIQWLKCKKRTYLLLLMVLSGILGITDWTGYLIVICLVFHAYVFYREQYKPLLLLLAVLSLTLSFNVLNLLLLNGWSVTTNSIVAFLQRIPLPTPKTQEFTWIEHIRKQWDLIVMYYTKPLLLLSLFWMILAFLRWWKTDTFGKNSELLALLLLVPITISIIFPNHINYHEYSILYYLPFIITSAANAINFLRKKLLLSPQITSLVFVSLYTGIAYYGLVTVKQIQYIDNLWIGREVGRVMRQTLQPNQATIIDAPKLDSKQDDPIRYYAQRDILFAHYPLPVWERQGEAIVNTYTYVVTIDGYLPEKEITNYYNSRFNSQKIGIFTFYKLQ